MPLIFEKSFDLNAKLWVWELKEDLQPSLTTASLTRLNGMKKEESRGCFLAVRHLLERAGYTDADLYYSSEGKPLLLDGTYISISHSENRAALYLGARPGGIDIQKIIPEKVQKAAYLFSEGGSSEMLTLEWAIKEGVYKLSDARPLDFKKDIHIKDGKVFSTFLGWERDFAVKYWLLDPFYLVLVT